MQGWWVDRKDATFLRAMQLMERVLTGISAAAVAGIMLKLKKAKFAQMTSINTDSAHFPHKPQEYKEEVLCQAGELHCGPHVPMPSNWPPPRAARYRLAMPDHPDIQTSIRLVHDVQQGTRVDPKAQTPPKSRAQSRMCPSLEAAALGELVVAILHAPTGSAIWVPSSLRHASYAGARVRILNGVVHRCLLKKEPQWLVRMSHPLMMEEQAKRKETTAIFHRLQAA